MKSAYCVHLRRCLGIVSFSYSGHAAKIILCYGRLEGEEGWTGKRAGEEGGLDDLAYSPAMKSFEDLH